MDPLRKGLDSLNTWLKHQNRTLDLVMVGAYALVIKNLPRSESTQDIDSVIPIDDEDINRQIAKIAEQEGLPKMWLNDQASTVTVPEGLIDRAEPISQWSNINVKIATRKDLITLKASAFMSRRDIDDKDYHDLLLLCPSQNEIKVAEQFIRKNFSPPTKDKEFIEAFEESIRDLYELTK